MKIWSEGKENTVIVYVEGRVDSLNSTGLEYAIREADIREHLIIDLKYLEYVSSAGLRVFLKLRKKHGDLLLRNASPEVYEILDMTGFTEIMKVTRAFRQISLEGCEMIAQGANGQVYRYDRDTIVKVYEKLDALEEIEHEREVAKEAFLLGIPTAISYDVVAVNEQYASMFEMLNAKSISNRLAENPDSIEENAEIFVTLLKLIHGTRVSRGKLPDQLEVTKGWVQFLEQELPEKTYRKLVALVDAIPQDDHVIHGDFHTKNVLVQGDEALLIDMDTLAVGHPILEMASVYNAFRGFYLQNPEQCEEFQGVEYDTITKFYDRVIQLYYDTTDPAVMELMVQKASVLGLVRLLRRCIRRNMESEVIDFYRNELIAVTERVDRLI